MLMITMTVTDMTLRKLHVVVFDHSIYVDCNVGHRHDTTNASDCSLASLMTVNIRLFMLIVILMMIMLMLMNMVLRKLHIAVNVL